THCTFGGLTATCELGDIAPGASLTFTFSGRAPTTADAGAVFTDQATVAAEGDTSASNDVSEAAITVERAVVRPTTPPSATPPQVSPLSTSPDAGTSNGGGTLPFTGASGIGLLVAAGTMIATGLALRTRGRRRAT